MQTFSFIFLAALALATGTKLWLATRHLDHIRRHREAVPAEFASDISLDTHRHAADYSSAKTRLGMFTDLFECAIILLLTFGGALQWFFDLTAGWFEPGVMRGVALLVLLGAATSVVDLPFA